MLNRFGECIHSFAERWHNAAMILFTAVLACFSLLLYCANRDYATTARAARRPWTGILGIGASCTVQDSVYTLAANQTARPSVSYRNFGTSPALHLGIYQHAMTGYAPPVHGKWTNDDLPATEDCWQKAANMDSGPAFPSSGESWYCNEEQDPPSFSTPNVEAVKAGTKGLYVRGCIVYSDDGGGLHHTDFCFYLVHDTGKVQGRFKFCPVGNFAD
jgi:hypothetical protein